MRHAVGDGRVNGVFRDVAEHTKIVVSGKRPDGGTRQWGWALLGEL